MLCCCQLWRLGRCFLGSGNKAAVVLRLKKEIRCQCDAALCCFAVRGKSKTCQCDRAFFLCASFFLDASNGYVAFRCKKHSMALQ